MAKVSIEASKMRDIVEYIQGTDSILAKQATLDAAIDTECRGVMDKLVSANVITAATKEACVSKIKQDPTYMLELLSKAAHHLNIEPEGRAVDSVKSASCELTADEVFVRTLMS